MENQMKDVLQSKKLFVFDMDGTIYLGGIPFDYAIRYIHHLRESGRRVLFFTNNASHSQEFYYAKLGRLGFDPQPGEIMSSGDVTAAFLTRNRPGKTVYLVGTPELWDEFQRAGVPMICDRDGVLTDPDAKADIVVTSFDTTLTYEKLTNACTFIREGAEYLSTHPDYNCPTETGFIPDSGAIAAAVTASTGVTPTYFGKPYKETVEMISEITEVAREDMCIFGDRLYTDIATGKKHGITAVLVLSGETKMTDVDAAQPEERPDMIFGNLGDVDALMFS
ncbi:MAG: HAD-IIA family hydrolase [Clostridia bacterium]|nr:HAD-IIA family hydrolase [Clostridia bacterium]